jgi:hypothetical protein
MVTLLRDHAVTPLAETWSRNSVTMPPPQEYHSTGVEFPHLTFLRPDTLIGAGSLAFLSCAGSRPSGKGDGNPRPESN